MEELSDAVPEVDTGNKERGIWAYNGGLFAPDPAGDAVVLPDRLATDLASLGQWDYRSDVPVTVLGHIFEQSVTDLERMRAESRGEAPPKVSKRKREGVVYTPDIVTRFLAERTVGKTLEERFTALLAIHATDSTLPSERRSDPLARRGGIRARLLARVRGGAARPQDRRSGLRLGRVPASPRSTCSRPSTAAPSSGCMRSGRRSISTSTTRS